MDPTTASLPAAGTAGQPTRRLVLPLLAVGALLALVFLLPSRDERATRATAGNRLDSVRVELDDPPDWARERGRDEVVRCLDRLAWGSHASIEAAREVLAGHAGQLAPELLGRLATAGDRDPPLASKLVELLGAEDPLAPGVLDELVRRALSFSALESKAALRVLSHVDHPRSVNAIRTRMFDTDPDVVGYARGALAQLARRGNAEARETVLTELEKDPVDVDLAFLTVASSFPHDPRTDGVLQTIAARGNGTVRLVALAGLVSRDDPDAVRTFEDMLDKGDAQTKIEVLRATATAGAVLGQSQWADLLQTNVYSICQPLVLVLLRAYDTGHPDAARALDLLERAATDQNSCVQSDVLDALFRRRHPNVIEGVRSDLQHVVGVQLSLIADRILGGPDELPTDKQVRADLMDLAFDRLAHDNALLDADRVTLCRLVAGVAPARAADVIVDYALGRHASLLVADSAADLLPALGEPGLARLSRELGAPAADTLMVYAAAGNHLAAALPYLKQLLCAPGTAPETRQAALDTLGLIHSGPREQTLREALECITDPALRRRAQLVFWNYL